MDKFGYLDRTNFDQHGICIMFNVTFNEVISYLENKKKWLFFPGYYGDKIRTQKVKTKDNFRQMNSTHDLNNRCGIDLQMDQITRMQNKLSS